MEWISVKDRLPDPKGIFPSSMVLVACNDHAILLGFSHRGEMHISCENCSQDRYVTHWMELPELPRE